MSDPLMRTEDNRDEADISQAAPSPVQSRHDEGGLCEGGAPSGSHSRREFLELMGIAGIMEFGGVRGINAAEPARRGRWRIPLRITERGGVEWKGERITVGVTFPAQCSARSLRLKNEETGQLIPLGAGYGGKTLDGFLRWCQISFPLHLPPNGRAHFVLELLDDAQANDSAVPAPIGSEAINNLDLGSGTAGIRWETDPYRGIYPSPTINSAGVTSAPWAWSQMAIADFSAPHSMVSAHLPLEDGDRTRLFRRVADPQTTVLDFQRTFAHGAYGTGYEFRQIHSYDLPDPSTSRPYALCDLVSFVHPGFDGIRLQVDGMALLLGSMLQHGFVWKARGDAPNPAELKHDTWRNGHRLPAGDWMMTLGEDGNAMLIIPWSAYTLDGYDLAYFVGRANTLVVKENPKLSAGSLLGGDASNGLAVALSRTPYRLDWGLDEGKKESNWGRSTYEFRCRLAWGKIDELSAERLARAYRCPPRVEVGPPERSSGVMALRCWPDHFTYAPGQVISIEVDAAADPERKNADLKVVTAEMQVQHRGQSLDVHQRVALQAGPNGRFHGTWRWPAPQAGGGGYQVSARLLHNTDVIESSPVAVEVLRHSPDLSQQIREGTICELYPDRDVDTLVDRFVDARINVAWVRNIFDFGQYTGPVDGSWCGREGCQAGDIGRPVRVSGAHLRRLIRTCHERGITVFVYGNLRNLYEAQYAEALESGLLKPEDVDLNARRWPFPDEEVNFRGLADHPRWQQYLVHEITDGMRRLGYDGYFFDNTSFANDSEAEMAHRILKATLAERPDQFVQINPLAQQTTGPVKHWQDPRNVQICRWPEVNSIQMEQEGINSPENILWYSQFYRSAEDSKTPVMYMNSPTRRSPEAQLIRLSYLLAGKATDDLCVGNSTHDAGVFFEQCPVSAAVTRTLYEGMAMNPELLEPGPPLKGVNAVGLKSAAVVGYDGLAAGGRARTAIIANRFGWDAPLRNVGYYWDGPKPAVTPAPHVVVTIPVPAGHPILGCWVVRPEGRSQARWKHSANGESVVLDLGEVDELAAVMVRLK